MSRAQRLLGHRDADEAECACAMPDRIAAPGRLPGILTGVRLLWFYRAFLLVSGSTGPYRDPPRRTSRARALSAR